MSFLDIPHLRNHTSSDSIANIGRLSVLGNLTYIDTSIGLHGVFWILLLKVALRAEDGGLELARVESGGRERVQGLEGGSGHAKSVAESGGCLLLRGNNGGLLSSRDVGATVLS